MGSRLQGQLGRIAVGALLLLGLIVATARGALAGDSESDTPASSAPVTWRIFFTGDTRGYIHPCGCSEGQFGGLPRRATYLKSARKPGDLLVDLGNLIEGTRPHERLKLSYLLEGLKLLEYDVLVPGEGELAFGEDYERAVTELRRPAVVCANLVLAESKKRPFRPWIVHEVPGGPSVALVGLTSPDQRLPARYRVLDPAEALASCLGEISDRADGVVVAAFLEGKPALDLARRYPDLRLILAGRVPRGSDALLERGGAPVMVGGERGQYVSFVDFAADSLKASGGGRTWLRDDIVDEPRIARLVERHDEDARKFGAIFAREAIATFRHDSWAGSVACAECHPDEYIAWEQSAHAWAMRSLVTEGQESNPNCMTCHMQDLPAASQASGLNAGVGCESCHGGARAHIEGVGEDRPMLRLLQPREAVRQGCKRCHDPTNSPRFEWAPYWNRITHGVTREGEG